MLSFHHTKWFSCLSSKLIIAPRFLLLERCPLGAERDSREDNKIVRWFGENGSFGLMVSWLLTLHSMTVNMVRTKISKWLYLYVEENNVLRWTTTILRSHWATKVWFESIISKILGSGLFKTRCFLTSLTFCFHWSLVECPLDWWVKCRPSANIFLNVCAIKYWYNLYISFFQSCIVDLGRDGREGGVWRSLCAGRV